MNIYCLQETHSSNENVKIFQDDWEDRSYSWRQKSPAVPCRLDFILVSVGLGNITRKTDIAHLCHLRLINRF